MTTKQKSVIKQLILPGPLSSSLNPKVYHSNRFSRPPVQYVIGETNTRSISLSPRTLPIIKTRLLPVPRPLKYSHRNRGSKMTIYLIHSISLRQRL